MNDIKENGINNLKEHLKPGSVIHSVRVNCGSKSRPQFIFLYPETREDGSLVLMDITWMIARALEDSRAKSGGIPCDDIDLIALLGLRLFNDHQALNLRRV